MKIFVQKNHTIKYNTRKTFRQEDLNSQRKLRRNQHTHSLNAIDVMGWALSIHGRDLLRLMDEMTING